MITTAINILATFRRVRSWLSNVRFEGFNLKKTKNLTFNILATFKGVMKRAVKWTSTDVDTLTDDDERWRAVKMQSGRRRPLEKGSLVDVDF